MKPDERERLEAQLLRGPSTETVAAARALRRASGLPCDDLCAETFRLTRHRCANCEVSGVKR